MRGYSEGVKQNWREFTNGNKCWNDDDCVKSITKVPLFSRKTVHTTVPVVFRQDLELYFGC